jgi:hypothetical protein
VWATSHALQPPSIAPRSMTGSCSASHSTEPPPTYTEMAKVQLTWISHASEASARRNPEFESIINVLQEVGPRPEENSLFFGLPVRYRACAISN